MRGIPVIPHKANEKGKPAFFARTPLQSPRAHRAGRRTAQALQAQFRRRPLHIKLVRMA
jgi:hypothetical protein